VTHSLLGVNVQSPQSPGLLNPLGEWTVAGWCEFATVALAGHSLGAFSSTSPSSAPFVVKGSICHLSECVSLACFSSCQTRELTPSAPLLRSRVATASGSRTSIRVCQGYHSMNELLTDVFFLNPRLHILLRTTVRPRPYYSRRRFQEACYQVRPSHWWTFGRFRSCRYCIRLHWFPRSLCRLKARYVTVRYCICTDIK
jgi:hypothetical protein